MRSGQRVLVCMKSVYCKYKNGYHNGGHDNFLLNCNVGCKKHRPMQNMSLE